VILGIETNKIAAKLVLLDVPTRLVLPQVMPSVMAGATGLQMRPTLI
jgi:hypothetical protein